MESTIILSEDLVEYDGGCRDKNLWVRFYSTELPSGPLFTLAELRSRLAELRSGAFTPTDKQEAKYRIAALKELLAEAAAVPAVKQPAPTVAGPEQLDMFGGEVCRG